MAWVTLRFDPEPDARQLSLFAQIPGFRTKGAWRSCPDHALWIVRDLAASFGLNIVAHSKTVDRTLSRIPLLREWVPAFMTPYQREGVAHALTEWRPSNESGIFVWATGSGKTLASQVWACATGDHHKTLVCTKSAVRYQWRDEAERFTEAPAVVIEGQTPSALPSSGFVVCGYDVLPFWTQEIQRWKPDSVIFDESHRVKNPKRWKATLKKAPSPIVTPGGGDVFAEGGSKVVATITPGESEIDFSLRNNQTAAAWIVSRVAKRRLATTATPIRDRVRDFWTQLDIVRPGEFGPYTGKMDAKAGFVWRYCNAQPGQFGGIDDRGMSNLSELRERLRFVTHYVPFSVANRDLPPARRLVTLVRVAEQNRPGAIAEDIKRAARVGELSQRRAAMIEARLWEAASRKRKRIVAIVEQAIEDKQKVCIFTGRRRDCEELESALKGSLERLWMAHGGHSDSHRRDIQSAYMNADGPAILIGTSDAWGEGLNLHDTDLGIVAMLPYTPGQVIQIEGRWIRLGMKRSVLIQYLIAESTIDERVAQILLKKLPAVEKVTDIEEVRGIAAELAGGNDDQLIAELAAQIGASL